ncbi:MAG TPA: LamG-like jellyroll fold domain-containing protein, partial [Tepidisphaeraceae bacterium]|nr:LamG-like jellyroll fold domain-containing protein [Tepidisphaeraceae bacterium]
GRSQYSVDPYLNGRVDDFRIYRGALPAGQVYTLATGNNAPAVPVAPAAFAATAIPGNQINLSWSAVGGATSYSLYRSTSASGPFWPIATVISGTTYADTDLAADLSSGTPYYYRVDAANAGGDGPTTSASAIALPPNASVPTSLVAKALSASAISLNWTASTNAATYTVRRSATSGGPYTVIASGLTNPTYTDTGRTVGTTYYYVVTAINASGETAFSNESNATPTDLFVHLKFDDGSGSIAADESGNGWNGTLANSPTWTSAGKVNGGLTLANVSVASNSTSAQTVSLPSGIVAGQTSFTIAAWVNLSTSATWMRLFDFGTGTNNYMFLSVNRGTSNQPRFAILAAGNATEEGINSNISVNTGVWTHLAVTYSNNLGTLYVNGFFAGSNAGMAWSPSTLGTTTQNYIGRSQWAADPVLNGTVDDFRIYAHALTATEVKALATAALPAAPSGLTATPVNGAGQVNLSWSATAVATKYHVYRSASSGGPYTEIAQSVSGTFYQDTNLSPDPNNGTTYYYVISAESAGGEGPQSAQASATLLPALPDSPTTLDVNVAKSGTLALSWDAAANAGSYIIARATSAAGPFTTIATVNGGATTSYTDAGLTNGRVYYYTVTSSNIAGVGEESPGDSAAPTDLYDYQKFDDATGTAAADASGHGYIGTLINGATWTTSSKIGPDALSLTGASSQYLSLPNGIVSGLTNFSVSAWVYLTTSTNWMRVFDFGTGTGNYMFLTVNRGTSFQPHFGILTTGNGTEQSINGNVSINTGIWTHLAVTWVNNLGTLYVNGAFAGSNSSMTWNPSTLGTTTQNYIGRSQFSADPYLNGRIDDFRIYSRALTLAEVSTIAANTLPSAPSGLSATVADGQATLTWNVASNAGTYNVKRSLSSGGPYSTITGGISGTSFIDTGLTDGTTYYYVVTGSNATGEGGNSAQLSVTPAPLSYAGTSDNDTYVIRLDPANLSMLQIFVDTPSTGSPTYEVRLSQIPSLSFDGTSGGGDQLAIDFANGNPVPGTGGVSFTGGDTLFIAGTTGADSFSIDGSHVSNNGVAPITYSNTARVEFDLLGGNDTLTQTAVPGAAVTFNGGAGNDTLNVNAGAFAFTGDAGATSANLSINVANAGSSVNFTGTQHLAALNLASGGAAAMTPAASPASAAIMNVASVIINGTGSSLNLSNNELLTATALATVQTQLDNSQLWTSVGGGALGSMIASGQTEVRYTLPGDTNLDGAVDVADLGALATNYGLTSGATWAQGDVNYDGAVNVGDLGMIATSYGATPAFTTTAPAAIAQPAAQAALITSGNVTGAASLNSPFAERPLYDEQADSTLDALLNPRKDHRELRAARHGVLER